MCPAKCHKIIMHFGICQGLNVNTGVHKSREARVGRAKPGVSELQLRSAADQLHTTKTCQICTELRRLFVSPEFCSFGFFID